MFSSIRFLLLRVLSFSFPCAGRWQETSAATVHKRRGRGDEGIKDNKTAVGLEREVLDKRVLKTFWDRRLNASLIYRPTFPCLSSASYVRRGGLKRESVSTMWGQLRLTNSLWKSLINYTLAQIFKRLFDFARNIRLSHWFFFMALANAMKN